MAEIADSVAHAMVGDFAFSSESLPARAIPWRPPIPIVVMITLDCFPPEANSFVVPLSS